MANKERLINANDLKANFVVSGEFAKDLWPADAIRLAIDNAPTVDAVKVVHGRWIYESVEFTYKKDIKCSVCSRYVDEPENYCPNCGAKMDGERKDNDYDNY
jgi:Pyruvate/2-oxoacid:ferredoxin oxidoreductase delta subunit